MDLNKIHYFFRAAEFQNFTKAAESCSIAQTTMSKYISVLEEELGCSLFLRTSQTPRLTPQGEQFYKGMKAITEQYQQLCQSLTRQETKELRIGMATTDYADFPMLRSFEHAHPDISIYFSFADAGKLSEDLNQHRLDALICPNILTLGQNSQDAFVRINLVSIEESLCCSRELLDQCGSIEEVIATQPFITKAHEQSYHDFCRKELHKQYGKTFSQVMTASGFPQQLLYLNLSKGFAIIPSQTAVEYKNLIFFPTTEIFYETAQLLYRPDFVTPSLRMLIGHIPQRNG